MPYDLLLSNRHSPCMSIVLYRSELDYRTAQLEFEIYLIK